MQVRSLSPAQMRKVVDSNGYRIVYEPNHPKAKPNGYVYEHVLVAERDLGRYLKDWEVVHHLDLVRSNNRKSNLLVLHFRQHARLHKWIESGCPIGKDSLPPIFCAICGRTCQEDGQYCSVVCSGKGSRKVKRPSKRKLRRLMKKYSMLKIGRKYGVSDNSVRKWARKYSLLVG